MDSHLSMVRFYKKYIIHLKAMLDKLDPASDDLNHLFEMQRYILKRILHTENKVIQHRSELKFLKVSLNQRGNSKEESSKIKFRISTIQNKIDGYNFLLYIWRCFGDGIAFKYISKWNLKRLLFHSDTSDIKPDPGFITGKAGLAGEVSLLFEAKSKGVPAILCDITNTIRHGDVCLLGAGDPFVIEVKTSNNSSKRIDRQLQSIKSIHSYLEQDTGNIAGVPGMRRVTLPIEEKHHNSFINDIINYVIKKDSIKLSPEAGLHYIGINVKKPTNYDKLFEGIKQPIIFSLNEAKISKRWDNYYPFTLSIKSPDSLYSFIKGNIFLLVVVDGEVMKRMASERGYDLEIILSDAIGLEFTKHTPDAEPFYFLVSPHFTGRLGFEFISLKWFFDHKHHLMTQMQQEVIAGTAPQFCFEF